MTRVTIHTRACALLENSRRCPYILGISSAGTRQSTVNVFQQIGFYSASVKVFHHEHFAIYGNNFSLKQLSTIVKEFHY